MPDARIVAGRYRLIAKLSEGGMGSVWSAEHIELKCPAAVKLLSSAFAESPEALARFKREAQAAASLRSTNIVQILDFGIEDGVPYIAMELLRGRTLGERLSAEGRIGPRNTAIILSQVARAVTWAHGMGIIHRDLKPSNIFLSQDAGEVVVKLLDFGIAKPMNMVAGESPLTITGTIVGTPQYMSPEQASGRRNVDHRTDIWAFGVIAYECITGQRAFSADTLGGLMLAICTDPLPVPSKKAAVPKGFDEWFARCSHRDPGRRFLSIGEAADILCFVCGLEPDAAVVPQLYSEPPSNPYGSLRHARRSLPPGISTDAPSTISLHDGTQIKRAAKVTKALVGTLIATSAGLAILARLSHSGGAAPAAALQPHGVEQSLAPKHEPDAGMALQANAAAPVQVIVLPPGKAADVSVTYAAVAAQDLRPRAAPASQAGQHSVPGSEATKPDAQSAVDRAPTTSEENPGQRPVATTVESAIGLRRRP